jgi:hypothetical protein
VVRLVGRILITVAAALGIVFAGVNWIGPVAFSFYAAEKAPSVARIVPVELKDKSVSKADGTKLSYFGYEFEVPWNDLDETQTKFFPKDKPEKTKVDLRFHSGLRLVFSAHSSRESVTDLPSDFSTSSRDLESVFGPETMKSDYSFAKALYEFTPDDMNYWTMSQEAGKRAELLLLVKSLALPKSAETGIFTLQNQSYKGFQQGNPRVRQNGIVVDLYSGVGWVEIVFLQDDYHHFSGVTQAEINRIVQSLRKSMPNDGTISTVASK